MAFQRYQYETSPRKLDIEYKKTVSKNKIKSTSPKNKQMSKEAIIDKGNKKKLIASLVLIFSAIFVISYRNSQIDESFAKNEELKQAYLLIEKENDQMNVDIENSLNLANVEQAAKEQLGMQNLSNKQTVYVNLPKKEYIQPATESVVINKNQTLMEKILNTIKNIF